MDPEVFDAIAKNDVPSFTKLVEENDKILDQRTTGSLNSVLHFAVRYRHIDLVKEIIRFRPDLVRAQNYNLEIPLHEACHQGSFEIVMLLLDAYPAACFKVDRQNRSALFIACSYGHMELVNMLSKQPWFYRLEDDDLAPLNPLHVAASNGHIDVVKCLLSECPDLANKKDENGCLPLHSACRRGRVSIISLLLRFDSNLAAQLDNNGHTPTHLAVLNDDPRILQEFVTLAPTSFRIRTRNQETVFHFAARFNRFAQYNYLVNVFRHSDLLSQPDSFGNTSLHIAIFRGHYYLAENIIHQTETIVNNQNSEGKTALDILNELQDTSSAVQQLKDLVKSHGGKTGAEINPTAASESYREEFVDVLMPLKGMRTGSESEHSVVSHRMMDHVSSLVQDYNVPTPESTSDWSNNSLRRRLSKTKKERSRSKKHPHSKRNDAYAEALQNARNTITIVAVLIATVTYTAGISPPGGVYQDGPLRGKSVAAKSTAFKVFTVSNNIALFVSMCIVIVLVSIIPFQRKPQMRLLTVSHKVMWMAIASMSTAYVAAGRVTTPNYDNEWTFAVLVSVCSGALGSVFIFLGVMLVRHWLRKVKWRRQVRKRVCSDAKDRRGESVNNSDVNTAGSTNSDVKSSKSRGYHTY